MIIFVPIKKNSNRVPNKNFRDFGGVPLYVHTLRRLKDYKVYVDTDCSQIINDIKSNESLSHVTPYKRSISLVGDDVSTCSLITDFILRNAIDDEVCQVHVTSPFINPGTLRKAEDFLEDYDSVVSCDVIQERLWVYEEKMMQPLNHNPNVLLPTQSLQKMYRENSLFYMFHPDDFLKSGRRVGNNPYFYETSFPESLDIDYEEDWNTCVQVYKAGLDGL